MKILITILISICLFSACEKEADQHLYIRGRLFLNDTITGIARDSALADKIVFLAYDNGDTLNYILSDTSDKEGYFLFNLLNIDNEKKFRLYYKETINGIVYSATQSVSKGPGNIALVATPDNIQQNGLHLVVEDESGGRLANTTAWVFNSPVLFAADTSLGKIFDMVTGTSGVANKFNFTAGKYYLRIKTQIGNLHFKGEAVVDIESKGIKTVRIVVNRQSYQNGMEIQILDSLNMPVNGTKVYLYKSRVVFTLDSTYANSLYSSEADMFGRFKKYNIEGGKYYIRGINMIGNITLKCTDSIEVPHNSIVQMNVIVH